MLSRRLTTLLVSILLLPSLVLGGGEGCIMGALGVNRAEAPLGGGQSAHNHGQHGHSAAPSAHFAAADASVHESDTSSPVGVPHAPAQCILVAGCGGAAVAATVIAIDEPAHVASGVDTYVALAPASPAFGLEPPPPRA